MRIGRLLTALALPTSIEHEQVIRPVPVNLPPVTLNHRHLWVTAEHLSGQRRPISIQFNADQPGP